jgi:hypothetical protein
VTARDEAVQAVTEALFARGQVACEFHGGTLYDECSSCCGLADELHRDALVAVTTAWPLIAEAVARRIDQAWAVVADSAPNPGRSREVQGFLDGMEAAEDIARNVGREVSG